MSEPSWDRGRYEREKRNFIERRLHFRSVYFHTALIFGATWLAGWLCSWALLRFAGMDRMPLRYGISFFVSYFVFIGCFRIWADFMRPDPSGSERDRYGGADVANTLAAGGGEGCAIVLVWMLLGLIAATAFSIMGGLPLLLEAAFELAFAGVVVRRISGKQELGNWFGVLIRNTWWQALLAFFLLVGVAAWLQAKAPQAKTFAQALALVWKARAG
jgi:hypothetical protein